MSVENLWDYRCYLIFSLTEQINGARPGLMSIFLGHTDIHWIINVDELVKSLL